MTHSSPSRHGVRPEQVRVGPALGLGHRIRRPDLLVEHRLEPTLLLLLGAVRGEHLHVAGVGRGRAEHLRRRRVAAEDLVEQAELELAVAGTAEVLVEEDRPETLVLHLVLEALHERPDLRVLRPHRVREHVLERLDLLAAELLDPVELLLELRLGREVPTHRMSPLIDASRPVCPVAGGAVIRRRPGPPAGRVRRSSRGVGRRILGPHAEGGRRGSRGPRVDDSAGLQLAGLTIRPD